MKEGEEDEPHRATVRRRAAGSSSPLQPRSYIHQLPDEVLEKIFALLSLKTIVQVLSVCRRWRRVIENWTLNKKLKFEDDTFTTQEALCLIRSAPNLKSLELSKRSDTVALLNAASARCMNLLHLSVDCGKFRILSLTDGLRRVFHTSPHITDVCLNYISTSESIRFYKDLGTMLPDLRKLRVNSGLLSDLRLDALVDSCSRNQMEVFKVRSHICSKETLAKLVQFWGRSLQVLELNAYNLTDGALAQLAGCSELRCLKLARLSTSGDCLRHWVALSHLEELDVSMVLRFPHKKWCRFFSQSRSSRKLRKLSLHVWYDGVDGRVLASVAASCPQLEELEVNGRNVTIPEARELLRCCPKLHSLHLYCADACVAPIVPELPQLAPQLRIFYIGIRAKCSLDEATLRLVQAQMPHLTID